MAECNGERDYNELDKVHIGGEVILIFSLVRAASLI
jgi:hypothetical protein